MVATGTPLASLSSFIRTEWIVALSDSEAIYPG